MKIISSKLLVILTVVVVVILLSGIVYAAMTLNQDVGVNITVNPKPGGGGGGGPVPGPTSAYLYKDSAFTQILTDLTFTYNEDGNASVTAYVKDSEINTLGTVTLSAGLTGITMEAEFGSTSAGAKEVIITASGGNSTTKNYTGTATFTGSGS